MVLAEDGAQRDLSEKGEGAYDERLETLHAVLLMMLEDYSALCEREGLRWVASFGTALGAIRHGGFIPWDDDVDICMPREDLDRLIEAVGRVYPDKYEVINARIDPRYPMMTTRLMLRGTEFRDDALAGAEFPSGIFLDLFPLDNLADDEADLRRQAWRAWLFNKLAIAKLIKHPTVLATGAAGVMLKAGSALARGILNLPLVRSLDLNERSYRWHTRYNGKPARRIGFMCDTDRFWIMYEWEDLFPVRMVPFETMEIPIARKAEKLLEDLYGDYLALPPEEQRSVHYPKVLDFGPYAVTSPRASSLD